LRKGRIRLERRFDGAGDAVVGHHVSRDGRRRFIRRARQGRLIRHGTEGGASGRRDRQEGHRSQVQCSRCHLRCGNANSVPKPSKPSHEVEPFAGRSRAESVVATSREDRQRAETLLHAPRKTPEPDGTQRQRLPERCPRLLSQERVRARFSRIADFSSNSASSDFYSAIASALSPELCNDTRRRTGRLR